MLWHPQIHSYDASLDGFGIVVAPLEPGKAAEVGRVRERMRFKDHRYRGKNPRITSELSMFGEFDLPFEDLFLNELSDSRILDMGKRAGFCEVPAAANEDLTWDVV